MNLKEKIVKNLIILTKLDYLQLRKKMCKIQRKTQQAIGYQKMMQAELTILVLNQI